MISDSTQNTQSKTAGPNRPAVFIVVLIILILLAGSIGYLVNRLVIPQAEISYACIYSDGELVKTIDLVSFDGIGASEADSIDTDLSNTICITNHEGHKNTILITRDGGIGVSEADCPNQICVNRGIVYIHSANAAAADTLPIVCLPNHLVITFEKSIPGSSSLPDSVTY